MTNHEKIFRKIWRDKPRRFSQFPGVSRIWFGFETRQPGEDYRWDGSKRRVEHRSAEVLFQCTLSGEGRFASAGKEWRVDTGSAFFARLPSKHVYWMPETGPHWTFFWMIIEHPFVVDRLCRLVEQAGPVIQFPEQSPALLASISLLTQSIRGAAMDEQEQEQWLLCWLLEQERHTFSGTTTPAALLMTRFETKVRSRLASSFGIEEIASEWGMSRSHFSHYFKKQTGSSPAAAVQEIRFGEVLRLLSDPHQTLEDIAAQTGFADGNHLGKAFRRRWGTSPGRFRLARFGVG